MEDFEKAIQANNLKRQVGLINQFGDQETIDPEFEKGLPIGHINAHGKQKQSDGSWKYVGKGKSGNKEERKKDEPFTAGGKRKIMSSEDNTGSKVVVGDSVKIPSNLTTDPAKRQGQSGTVSTVSTTGDITVKFSDGNTATYSSGSVEKTKKDTKGTEKEESPLLKNLVLNERISVEKFLETVGTDAETLAKSKDRSLDQKVYFIKTRTVNFSGSWGVPNPSTDITYHISDNGFDDSKLAEKIKENKTEEKVHRKEQNRRQKNHDYQYQRPSTTEREYGITTLRKVLKTFENRPKSSRSTMTSQSYSYNLKKVDSI